MFKKRISLVTPQWQQGPSFFTIGGAQSLKLLNPFMCGTIAHPSANNKLGEAYIRSLYMDVDGQWIIHSFAKDLAASCCPHSPTPGITWP